MSIRKLN